MSHRGSSRLARVIPSMHVHLCVVWWLFSFTLVSFSSPVPLLFFQTFQMSSSEFHEKFKSKDLRDFRLGTVASNDHETPLTTNLTKSRFQSVQRAVEGHDLQHGRNGVLR